MQPWSGPDFTVISYETVKRDMFVHTSAGERTHLDMRLVQRAIKAGTIRESLKPGFTLPHGTPQPPRFYISRGRQADIAGRKELIHS